MYRVILTSHKAKQARINLGLSQGRVANAVGLNRTYLSLFENGKYVLPDRDLKKLHGYYSEMGAAFDGDEAPDEGHVSQMESDNTDVGQTTDVRVMDGFAIPDDMNDDEVELILSEYADNAEAIRRLCAYELRKNHTGESILFWDGELDEREVEKRIKEVLVLMARNYRLIELVQGHRVGISTGKQPYSALNTTGDFVGALFSD